MVATTRQQSARASASVVLPISPSSSSSSSSSMTLSMSAPTTPLPFPTSSPSSTSASTPPSPGPAASGRTGRKNKARPSKIAKSGTKPSARRSSSGRRPRLSPANPTRFQPFRACCSRPPTFPRFLDLPAEIRRHVYAHLLTVPDAADVSGVWRGRPRVKGLALLRTSRMIRAEAAHFFYSTNTFCFLEHCDAHIDDSGCPRSHRCHAWLRAIGPENAASIRSLHLRTRAPAERPATYYSDLIAMIARAVPNLTRLAVVAEKHFQVPRHDSSDEEDDDLDDEGNTDNSAGANGSISISSSSSSSSSSNGFFADYDRWEPNFVSTLSARDLNMVLRPSDRPFAALRTLVLAGAADPAFLAQLACRYECKVQCVTRDAAGRKDRCSVLWAVEPWFQASPIEWGQEENRPGGGDGSASVAATRGGGGCASFAAAEKQKQVWVVRKTKDGSQFTGVVKQKPMKYGRVLDEVEAGAGAEAEAEDRAMVEA